MSNAASVLLKDIETHINEIWVNEPNDICKLKHGIIDSGAGIRDQYYTVLVMLSGEVRALGIHIFSDLQMFARSNLFSLEQLTFMTRKMLQVDLGVIGYFGLEDFGKLLDRFSDLLGQFETIEEYSALCESLFILSNRYQLWLHQIFPWYLMSNFPKTTLSAEIDRLKRLTSLE